MKREINQISIKFNLIFNAFFILGVLACIVPLLIVFSASLSSERSILLQGYSLLPKDFTLASYKLIFNNNAILIQAYKVTIISTVFGTLLSVLVTALFAYPLSRYEVKYRKFFNYYIFIPMIFSGGIVPWYVVCTQFLHLRDTYMALILPYAINGFNVIIVRTFFKTTIPDALIESAKIDGVGDLRIFCQIVLPLSKPVIATIALFNTITFWNDWWLPLNLTNDQKFANLQYTLQKMLNMALSVSQIASQSGVRLDNVPTETVRMAMCILALGPIVIVYPFFQKHFVKGLMIGALKG